MINISQATRDAIRDGAPRCHLVTFHFKNATLRYTENAFDVVYLGNTYLANGLLLDMGEPRYTSELRVNETEIALSGADLTTTAIILNEPPYNRLVTVERAYLDGPNVIGEPIPLVNWFVSDFGISDSANGESVVTIALASEFANWEKPSGRRTTESSQQAFYPLDKGMQFAAGVKKQLKWGGK